MPVRTKQVPWLVERLPEDFDFTTRWTAGARCTSFFRCNCRRHRHPVVLNRLVAIFVEVRVAFRQVEPLVPGRGGFGESVAWVGRPWYEEVGLREDVENFTLHCTLIVRNVGSCCLSWTAGGATTFKNRFVPFNVSVPHAIQIGANVKKAGIFLRYDGLFKFPEEGQISWGLLVGSRLGMVLTCRREDVIYSVVPIIPAVKTSWDFNLSC